MAQSPETVQRALCDLGKDLWTAITSPAGPGNLTNTALNTALLIWFHSLVKSNAAAPSPIGFHMNDVLLLESLQTGALGIVVRDDKLSKVCRFISFDTLLFPGA
jgi:hypothetical protein